MSYGTETAQSITATVAARMKAVGVSEAQLSAKTGIPRSTLHTYFSGMRAFPIDKLAVVANVLGTTVADLAASAEDAA